MKWIGSCLTIYKKPHLDGSRIYREFVELWILTKMNLLKCYRGSIDGKKSVSVDQESVENLSSRQRAQKFGLMDQKSCRVGTQKSRWIEKLSRFYWEETQKSQWIEKLLRCYREGREHRKIPQWTENLSRIYWERRKTSSIERNLLRIYREAVKLEEKEFFKEAETQGNICNKQATQPKIQTTC